MRGPVERVLAAPTVEPHAEHGVLNRVDLVTFKTCANSVDT